MPLAPTSQPAARSSSSKSTNSPQTSTSTSAPSLVQPAAALSSLKSTSTFASGALDELLRGGRHFRHPCAPSFNSLYLTDTDEHWSAGALAHDAPDWWGWGGGGLVGGGVAPNSSTGSSCAHKLTGILSGGNAWQRFTRAQSEMGGSDSESEVESARSSTLSGLRASTSSPFWRGGNARFEADEQPKIASDWGEDEGIVSTMEPPSKAAAATSQAKAAQGQQQRKEDEMFAHIRTKLKRLALHHAKYHMEHGAHEYQHTHAHAPHHHHQQQEPNHMHMMQQQEQQIQTQMQAQQLIMGGQVPVGVHPGTQQRGPPNPAAEEEARELASAAQTIHQHARMADVLCEQEDQASAVQAIHEHAPYAEVLSGQNELASLFDLPPETDSSAEAATHAILHPFSALLPTHPQAFDSCLADPCTPPTPPASSRSLSSHHQHSHAFSQQQQRNSHNSLLSLSQHSRQQQQQQNSHGSLLSVSQHSRQQQQQQQQQNSHSSPLSASHHGSGRSRKSLSPAHAPSQHASASLFLHGRSRHTSVDSMDLEEEPGDGIVIDASGKPLAYRRIDSMHARLPDSPKLSHSETPALGGSSGRSSSSQHTTILSPSPFHLHHGDAHSTSRLSPSSSAPQGYTNQDCHAYGADSHGLFWAPSPLSSASQVRTDPDAKSITCTNPGCALGHLHNPGAHDALASLFEARHSCVHDEERAMSQDKTGVVRDTHAHQEGPGAGMPGCLNGSVVSGVVGGGGDAGRAGVGAGGRDADGACVEGVVREAWEQGRRDSALFCSEGGAAGEEEAEAQGEETIIAALLTHKTATRGADPHAGISVAPGGVSTLPQRTLQRSLSCTAAEAEVAGELSAAATSAAAAPAAGAVAGGRGAAAAATAAAAPASTGQVPDSVRCVAPAPAPPLRVASPAIMAALAARARLRQQRGALPFRRGHTGDALQCMSPDRAPRSAPCWCALCAVSTSARRNSSTRNPPPLAKPLLLHKQWVLHHSPPHGNPTKEGVL